MVAPVVMGMYVMIASTYQGTGLLTPLYHMTSSVRSPTAMMESMEAAAAGDAIHMLAGSALLGGLVHMMVGAMAGIVFVLLAGLRPMSRATTVAAGVAFGLVMMVVNTLVVLPVTAHVLGGGDPIAHMGAVAGWLTLTVEHALFGLALGLLVAATSPRMTHPAAEPRTFAAQA